MIVPNIAPANVIKMLMFGIRLAIKSKRATTSVLTTKNLVHSRHDHAFSS